MRSRLETTEPPGFSMVTANIAGSRTSSLAVIGNDHFALAGRNVEHAAVDRVALIARAIENPQLILQLVGVVGLQAAEAQIAILALRIPHHVAGDTAARRILRGLPGSLTMPCCANNCSRSCCKVLTIGVSMVGPPPSATAATSRPVRSTHSRRRQTSRPCPAEMATCAPSPTLSVE